MTRLHELLYDRLLADPIALPGAVILPIAPLIRRPCVPARPRSPAQCVLRQAPRFASAPWSDSRPLLGLHLAAIGREVGPIHNGHQVLIIFSILLSLSVISNVISRPARACAARARPPFFIAAQDRFSSSPFSAMISTSSALWRSTTCLAKRRVPRCCRLCPPSRQHTPGSVVSSSSMTSP